MTRPTPGQPIQALSAAMTSGKTFRLDQHQGRNLVLYFYPKDNTPGCTQEGLDFRDLAGEFKALDADIFGVSRDSLKSHENVKCKYEFPFDLITDPDEALCNLFDVIRMKNMYGKQVRGIERSTFLIDRAGRLAREWRKVSVKGHVQAVLDALRELESTAR